MTDRQRKCLTAIYDFMKREKYAPTNAEIAELMGVVSTYGVRKHLDRLQDQGLITHINGCCRSIRITAAGLSSLNQ